MKLEININLQNINIVLAEIKAVLKVLTDKGLINDSDYNLKLDQSELFEYINQNKKIKV